MALSAADRETIAAIVASALAAQSPVVTIADAPTDDDFIDPAVLLASVASGPTGAVARAKKLYPGKAQLQRAWLAATKQAGHYCTAGHGFIRSLEHGSACPASNCSGTAIAE